MTNTEIESQVKISEGSTPMLQRMPLLRVRPEMIAQIGQGEMGVSGPGAKSPYLATFGIGPCVALVGWDSARKSGFIAHIDYANSFDRGLGDLLYHLRIAHAEQKFDGQVLLMSTESRADSEIVLQTKKLISQGLGDVRLRLVNELTGASAVSRIVLDTRNGGLFDYPPFQLQGHDAFDTLSLYSSLYERIPGSEGMKVTYSVGKELRQ